MKIGIADLGTSHPGRWIPIIRELGVEVAGVWDGGRVYPEGYAAYFAKKHEIEKAYGSLEELVEDVDVVFSQSCDWDVHLARARAAVDAGKAAYLDKPICGNVRDLDEFLQLCARGRVTGGSSVRYAVEALEFMARPPEERGEIACVNAFCGVDEFNYGIHGYELLGAILTTGAESVSYLGMSGKTLHFQVEYASGVNAFMHVPTPHSQFAALVTTTTGSHWLAVAPGTVYRELLKKVLPFFAGDAPEPTAPEALAESVKLALAARVARATGKKVPLSDLRLDDPGYDGEAFALEYRRKRKPKIDEFLKETGRA